MSVSDLFISLDNAGLSDMNYEDSVYLLLEILRQDSALGNIEHFSSAMKVWEKFKTPSLNGITIDPNICQDEEGFDVSEEYSVNSTVRIGLGEEFNIKPNISEEYNVQTSESYQPRSGKNVNNIQNPRLSESSKISLGSNPRLRSTKKSVVDKEFDERMNLGYSDNPLDERHGKISQFHLRLMNVTAELMLCPEMTEAEFVFLMGCSDETVESLILYFIQEHNHPQILFSFDKIVYILGRYYPITEELRNNIQNLLKESRRLNNEFTSVQIKKIIRHINPVSLSQSSSLQNSFQTLEILHTNESSVDRYSRSHPQQSEIQQSYPQQSEIQQSYPGTSESYPEPSESYPGTSEVIPKSIYILEQSHPEHSILSHHPSIPEDLSSNMKNIIRIMGKSVVSTSHFVYSGDVDLENNNLDNLLDKFGKMSVFIILQQYLESLSDPLSVDVIKDEINGGIMHQDISSTNTILHPSAFETQKTSFLDIDPLDIVQEKGESNVQPDLDTKINYGMFADMINNKLNPSMYDIESGHIQDYSSLNKYELTNVQSYIKSLEYCLSCSRIIKDLYRIPSAYGGWEGRYCSYSCILEEDLSLLEKMLTRIFFTHEFYDKLTAISMNNTDEQSLDVQYLSNIDQDGVEIKNDTSREQSERYSAQDEEEQDEEEQEE